MDIRARHKKLHEALKSELDTTRTWQDELADFLTSQFGTMWFFALNAGLFGLWIIVNLGLISGIVPFDPFPFNFLTMIVSLEAIFLSIIVLVSQNRQSRVADMRDKIDFEVNVRAEEEDTKLLVMTERIARHLNIPLARDPELKELEQRTDLKKIQQRVEEDK